MKNNFDLYTSLGVKLNFVRNDFSNNFKHFLKCSSRENHLFLAFLWEHFHYNYIYITNKRQTIIRHF